MPDFSVIIPVYNSQPTLKRCIDSVLNQSYQDFEVLCCYDDCADGSKEIIYEYCKKDERIKCIQGRKKGLSGARNDGIKAAAGNYILFLDSDDIFSSEALLRVKQEFEERQCDIVVFGSKVIAKDQNIDEWYYKTLTTPDVFYPQYTVKALLGEDSARPFVWRNSYQKTFILNHNLYFDEECMVGEDHVFQMCAFPNAKNGISYISDELYSYSCAREGSLMDIYAKDNVFRITGHIKMVNSVFTYWEKYNYEFISKKDIAIWAVFFLTDEIPYLQQKEIDALSKDLNHLITEYFDDEFVGSLPDSVRNRLLLLQEPYTHTKDYSSLFFDLLWWNYYFNGIQKAYDMLFEKVKVQERELMNIRRNLENAECQLAMKRHELECVYGSLSFRMGRMATLVPRKLRNVISQMAGKKES